MAVNDARPISVAIQRSEPRILNLVLLLLASTAIGVPATGAEESYTLRTVYGRVLSVDRESGGERPQVRAAIELDAGDTLRLEFAPTAVCAEIGFSVHEGDRLRARVFVDGEGAGQVQNVRNFSRGTMIRLRTMHRTPLWDASGRWYGGQVRTGPGPHRIRAGGSSRRGGPS